MKKIISILLAALLVAAILPAAAFADGPAVVLSPQNLRVDGVSIACEKYNIDGSNYFKLRDIAMVLSGTGSEFSVGWDGEKKVISVVTGEEYEPNGSELDLSGGDKSATAVPGTQTLIIDGAERSDLSAWNIGGNNFFKLRDLGDALGFRVDYDKPSNTAIIVSRVSCEPAPWRVVETIWEDDEGNTREVITYDEDGFILENLLEADYGMNRRSFVYDELGRIVRESFESRYDNGGEIFKERNVTEHVYDMWGQLSAVTWQDADGSTTVTTYTYDADGGLTAVELAAGGSRTVERYTRDGNGCAVRCEKTFNGKLSGSEEYAVDEDGNVLREVCCGSDGEVFSITENVYTEGLLTESVCSFRGRVRTTRYAYDGAGRVIRCEEDGAVTTHEYDGRGNELRSEYVSEDYSSVTVWSYDGEGRLLGWEFSGSNSDHSSEKRSYDAEGNLLTCVYSGYGYTRTETYTYDRDALKQTVRIREFVEGLG